MTAPDDRARDEQEAAICELVAQSEELGLYEATAEPVTIERLPVAQPAPVSEIERLRQEHATPGMTAGEFAELLPAHLRQPYWRAKIAEAAANGEVPDDQAAPSASAGDDELREAENWWRAYVADDMKTGWRGRAVLLAEYDRRGEVERRAREVRDVPGWTADCVDAAEYILGET